MSTTTEEKQQTITEFCAKHGITMKAQYIGQRSKDTSGKAKEHWGHFLWLCTLSRGCIVMDQEYRMGLAHVTVKPAPPKGMRPGTVAHREHVERYGRPTPPDVEDVLDSLLADSCAIDQTFEDWASEFGYDEDSREAERIYHACRECGRKLVAFLGRDLLNELNQCERL